MRGGVEERLRALAQRAGVSRVPRAAVAAAGVVFAIAIVAAAWVWWPRGAPDATFPSSGGASGSAASSRPAGGAELAATHSAEATTVDPSAVASSCVVHVVGAVRHPGVYELRPGQRAVDAVQAAGGMLGDAAQSGLNLAQVLQDGEQIVVPTTDELAKGITVGATGGTAVGGGGSAPGPAGGQAGGALVNLNTADATQLDSLPGVGPATAAKIVADRAANGPFKSPDDLGRVPGIGPKKLDQLKALVCVR